MKKAKPKESTWTEDPSIVKLEGRLRKRGRELITLCGEVREELFRMQDIRIKKNKVTYEEVTSRGMKTLIEAMARDKSYRSRVVALLMEVRDRVDFLKDSLSLIRRKVRGNYGAQLKRLYGAVSAQNDAIENHFHAAMQGVKGGEAVIRMAELVVSDIDKSAFADKGLQKGAELIFHPGRAD
jgi:hypothetical protein